MLGYHSTDEDNMEGKRNVFLQKHSENSMKAVIIRLGSLKGYGNRSNAFLVETPANLYELPFTRNFFNILY